MITTRRQILLAGEFDPLCPLDDAIEVHGDNAANKEMWVVEDRFHPLWGLPNLGGLDCHDYVADWCARALIKGVSEKEPDRLCSREGAPRW